MYAESGLIDLTNWDFSKDGPVSLEGEWQFFWKQLHEPDDFKKDLFPTQTGLISLPGLWNGYRVDNTRLGSHGFATFRLEVLLKPGTPMLAIKAYDMATAYRLWVNEDLVLSNGIVGDNAMTMKPQFHPDFSGIESRNQKLLLTLQVSNFHHKKGGAWMPLVLGKESQIIKMRERTIGFEMFLLGCMMVMAFYHAGLFLLRKKDPSPLYFGLVCFLAGIRSTLVGERFLVRMFPDFSWEIFHKLEYITFYLCIPFFIYFLVSLFPEFTRRFGRFVMIVACLFCLATLVTPARINTHGLLFYHLFLVGVSLYSFWIFYRVIKNNWEGAGWILSGVIILLVAVFIDILAVNDIVRTINISPLGLFFFVFFQSMMLSIRFYKAFKSLETVTHSLSRTYQQKDALVKALRENEKKYRELVENMEDVIFTMDLQNRFEYVSPAIEKIIKYQPNQLIGTPTLNYFHPEDTDKVLALLAASGNGDTRQAELRVYTKPGDLRWIRFKVRPIYKVGMVSGFQGFMSDVTETICTRELMIQTEKLVSVGGLAGGMAHELNNPLAAIMQANQNIIRRLTTSIRPNLEAAGKANINLDNLQKYLDERKILYHLAGIKRSAERAADIIRNMLQFSRKSEGRKNTVTISEVLDNAVGLANADYDLKKQYDFRKVEIIKDYQHPLPPVKCNKTEIEQVVFNLIKNAGQAMAGVGSDGDPEIRLKISVEEEMIRIEIADNGPGMEEAHRKRIFEPFYTTKIEGNGTGLGLSVSRTIVTENHNGGIEVESEPGSGTRFIIRLPLSSLN